MSTAPQTAQQNSQRSRARILGKLRQSAPTAHDSPLPAITRHFATTVAAQPQQDLERFSREITAAHAEVQLIDPENWVEAVANVCGKQDVITLACPREARFSAAIPALQAALTGLKVVQPERAVEQWKDELFTAFDAGLTLATGAIAETGTLLLCPGQDEPRTLSLVPPLHIVLVVASTIYPTLYALQQSPLWPQPLPTNLLLVSGPSKTADIQQTLAYGAHGPKALVVLILNDLNLNDMSSGGAA